MLPACCFHIFASLFLQLLVFICLPLSVRLCPFSSSVCQTLSVCMCVSLCFFAPFSLSFLVSLFVYLFSYLPIYPCTPILPFNTRAEWYLSFISIPSFISLFLSFPSFSFHFLSVFSFIFFLWPHNHVLSAFQVFFNYYSFSFPSLSLSQRRWVLNISWSNSGP